MFSSCYKRKQEEKAPLVIATFLSAWDTVQENVNICHRNHKGYKSLKVKGKNDGRSLVHRCLHPNHEMDHSTNNMLCEIKKHLPFKQQDSGTLFSLVQSVVQSCPTLCDPTDCSTPGFPVYHQLVSLIFHRIIFTDQIRLDQSLSHVRLFATP